jgi:transposase
VWVLQVLAEKKLLKGTTIGVDATTLEAGAALRSILRRDTGERYEEFLMRLAKECDIETSTREQLASWIVSVPRKALTAAGRIRAIPMPASPRWRMGARIWLTRPNTQWMWRPERTSRSRHGADVGDTRTIPETIVEAADCITSVVADTIGNEAVEQAGTNGPREVITDKAISAARW